MSGTHIEASDPSRPRSGLRLWHLSVTIAVVALAGALVHEGRMRDPVLIAIAVTGFLGWCAAVAFWIARLNRGFRRFDRIADRSRRRGFKVASGVLYALAALLLFATGLAILVVIQLRFFPHAL
jgi:hypothetical protein